MELGFALSSEDHPPNELVRQAQLAERAGFTFGLISDHFHPWVSEQGHSPFVWSTLGGIAQATSTIRVGTGVTCPTIRIHPAILAQAAAMVDEEDMAESTPHGPDPQPYLDLIRDYEKAGFTHVYMHQIGDNQDEFLDFAGRELLPNI